jgi:formate dehydrogenase iron-sulfur subunit
MSGNSLLIDASLCTGCKACQSACKAANRLGTLPEDQSAADYSNPARMSSETWSFVDSGAAGTFVQRLCYHCEDAACLKSCPEHAISRYSGWVVVDKDKCIGCRTCEGTCPYDAIHVGGNNQYTSRKGKAQKCDGCTAAGLDIPACVSACPSGAISFGNRMKLIRNAMKRAAELNKGPVKYVISGIEQNGGMNVLTIDVREVGKIRTSSVKYDTLTSKFVYMLFSPFSLGMPVLKRKIWDLSRILSLENDENGKKKV